MVKPWIITYRGQLVTRKLTQSGAQAMAYRLIQEKTWDAALIAVKEELGAKTEGKSVATIEKQGGIN